MAKQKSKADKIQDNLWYMREQLVRYLYANYRIKTNFQFYANKDLKKKSIYIKTTFPKEKWETIEIDVCYELLASGKKKLMLDTAFKEAVRIGRWFKQLPYVDGHPDFENDLKQRGITGYNGVAEQGLELHQYGCSECKKLYILKRNKLPKSKCPEEKGLKSTCCKAPIQYFGTKFYKTDILQKIKERLITE